MLTLMDLGTERLRDQIHGLLSCGGWMLTGRVHMVGLFAKPILRWYGQ